MADENEIADENALSYVYSVKLLMVIQNHIDNNCEHDQIKTSPWRSMQVRDHVNNSITP